jgi:hypothetical protein
MGMIQADSEKVFTFQSKLEIEMKKAFSNSHILKKENESNNPTSIRSFSYH